MTPWWYLPLVAAAAMGFAMVFNVRRRTLLPIGGLAMVGFLVNQALMAAGFSHPAASFLAALAVGIFGTILARTMQEASPVFTFAPVIPLVPGQYIFDALTSLTEWIGLERDNVDASILLTEAVSDTLTAAAIVVSLAVGATAPFLFLPRARKPT